MILDVALFGPHGTDPAAAFLSDLAEKHHLADTVFLADQFGYRIGLAQLELSGQINYTDRNLTERLFYTPKLRVDRFYNSWMSSRRNVR
ncbi:hypothetical protein [Candidatus Halobonum tyrrellensis]|uniref:hypothetical protein n=1 Tax=Candidatus Halobonum tyrrellensis TaxID=1431545 RepID=UPI0013779CEC